VRQKETYSCGGQSCGWGLRGNTHSVGGQSSSLGLRCVTEIVLITLRSVNYVKYVLCDSYCSEDAVV